MSRSVKSALFAMVTVAGVFGIIELLAFIGLSVVFEKPVSHDFLSAERGGLSSENNGDGEAGQRQKPRAGRRFQVEQALHPFLGCR